MMNADHKAPPYVILSTPAISCPM